MQSILKWLREVRQPANLLKKRNKPASDEEDDIKPVKEDEKKRGRKPMQKNLDVKVKVVVKNPEEKYEETTPVVTRKRGRPPKAAETPVIEETIKHRKIARDARVDDLLKDVDDKEDGRHRDVYEKRCNKKIGKIMDQKASKSDKESSEDNSEEKEDSEKADASQPKKAVVEKRDSTAKFIAAKQSVSSKSESESESPNPSSVEKK